jgi:hypothetical protein
MGLALGILPEDIKIEDIEKIGGDSGLGGMLTITLMMLNQITDQEEKRKLIQALKNDNDYINPELKDIKQVSFSEYLSVCKIALKGYEQMLNYGKDSFEELSEEDKEIYIKLNKVQRIIDRN